MTHPFLLTLGASALLFLMPRAASAQALSTIDEPASVATDQDEEAAPVFQLIEHRVGPTAGPTSVTRPASIAAVPVTKQPTGLASARVRVLAFIRAAETRHALPRGLLEALVEVESAYQPFVVSRAGAMGLAQLMPATARALRVPNPFDARANLEGGARFLRAMLDRFGSVSLALAAYNAGPAAVMRSRGVPANSETPAYIRKVLAAWSAGAASWRAE